MKCPKCKIDLRRVTNSDTWYCVPCGKFCNEAPGDPESQLKRPTPTEVPQVTESPAEANVERLRPILACGPRKGRGSKYGNKITELSGIKFASKHEADVYDELCMMEAAGEIEHLACQVRCPIMINGLKVCTYIADFHYKQDGVWAYVDAKGFKTPVYKLKKKLMFACLGIDIVEM